MTTEKELITCESVIDMLIQNSEIDIWHIIHVCGLNLVNIKVSHFLKWMICIYVIKKVVVMLYWKSILTCYWGLGHPVDSGRRISYNLEQGEKCPIGAHNNYGNCHLRRLFLSYMTCWHISNTSCPLILYTTLSAHKLV